MRGFDYRAPKNGITLLVNASFENERAKLQGLGRVKRFKDPGSVIQVEGVPLIDEKAELAYKKTLMSFASQFITKKSRVVRPNTQQKLAVAPSLEKIGGMTTTRANKLIQKSQMKNTNAKK
jgi:hypothetical protein